MSGRLSSVGDYEGLLAKFDTWMFDCDGVLWNGDRPVDGAIEVLNILRRRREHCNIPCHSRHENLSHGAGKKIIFVTNNATKSRKSYKSKFDKLGVEAHLVSIVKNLP